VSAEGSSDLLTSLLRDVSRSFHLTLRVLPGPIRRPIALGYLLARATDTIADTELVPVEDRLEALARVRDRILGRSRVSLELGHLARAQEIGVSPAERILLERIEEGISVLEDLEGGDRERVRWVLEVIVGGQELDLRRFRGATGGGVMALPDAAALEDYTYRVAGCVGEFWTRMCRVRLFPEVTLDEAALLRDGIRFGQGLQLVNILRDLPRDLAQGRCYLPADELAAVGLSPGDLLDPGNEARLWPVYERWLSRAGEHLEAGWGYTTRLPRKEVRVRLACAWPVLLGILTLGKLKRGGVLDATRRIKVSRGEVRGVMWRSVVRLPVSGWWDGLADWARNR
jgi:farnesyl-diphosphate farnesyltransferase